MKTTLRVIGAATAAAAVVALSAGCATDDKAAIPGGPAVTSKPTATTAPSPGSSTSAAPSTAPGFDTIPDPKASFVPFTGPAAKKFGADKVNAAYQHAIGAAFKGIANPSLLMLEKPRVVDFTEVNTFYAEATLNESVLPNQRAVEAGNSTDEQRRNLQAMTVWNLEDSIGNGFKLRAPYVRNFVYGATQANVETAKSGVPLLKLNFPVAVQYLGTVDGKPVYFQVKQEREVFLKETGDPDQPWAITEFETATTGTGPTADQG